MQVQYEYDISSIDTFPKDVTPTSINPANFYLYSSDVDDKGFRIHQGLLKDYLTDPDNLFWDPLVSYFKFGKKDENLRRNLDDVIAVNVFFKQQTALKITWRNGVTLGGVLGNVGGNLGLFMGISIISMIEVILFFGSMLLKFIRSLSFRKWLRHC